jgi:hypothetical protein
MSASLDFVLKGPRFDFVLKGRVFRRAVEHTRVEQAFIKGGFELGFSP